MIQFQLIRIIYTVYTSLKECYLLRSLTLISLFILCLLINGCATMSGEQFFSHYSQQVSEVRTQLQNGQPETALSLLPHVEPDNSNYNLILLEKALLEFDAGNYEKSKQTFDQALIQIDKQQQSAQIELSKGVENLNAMLTNDNAIGYSYPTYETTMVHSYQVLNYLMLNDLESAMVEVRRANLVQEQALVENQDEINQHLDQLPLGFNDFPAMDSVIGDIKNGFQNAYTFYLSGLLYEISRQPNDAYIDYKRALEIYPNNPYLQHDVYRLAKQLGFYDDVEQLEQQFKIQKNTPTNTAQGQVVIITHQDLVPTKQQARIDIPYYTSKGDLRFYSVATPHYDNVHTRARQVHFTVGETQFDSAEIVNMASLAAKDLADNMPYIVSRQVARVIAKEKFRKKMAKEGGDLGNVLATLYNIASEQADTRSWLTLPANVQIAKQALTPGKHVLNIQQGSQSMLSEIDVKPGRTTLVLLTSRRGELSNSTLYL